ncbi:MAG: hypothetical protein P8K83_05675 [Woeseiaceae bacterium]|jgi:hypothetical protein|nr:hypothetical protein [Gammaproteobacteria bacterium]MDG2289275.1 hypothetical protein [Woeseiaceae bacterium]
MHWSVITTMAADFGHQYPTLTTYGRANPGDFLVLINTFGVVGNSQVGKQSYR